MSIHRTITAGTIRPAPPATGGGISARGRMAVIAGLSAWLWAGIGAIGWYALG